MSYSYDILIVDDEQIVVDSAREVFSEAGYTADSVYDAEEAQKRLRINTYRIMVSDLMLPNVSGIALFKKIRSEYPEMPVIIITGYATIDNAIQCFKEGIFDFIPKPFTTTELTSVISRALNFQKTNANKLDVFSPLSQMNEKDRKKYLFLGNHSWARYEEDDLLRIGAGWSFSNNIGKVTGIEFPEISQNIIQGQFIIRIHCEEGKSHNVWSPVSGEVIEMNTAVQRDFTLVNTAPFTEGWMIKVKPSCLNKEVLNLLSWE